MGGESRWLREEELTEKIWDLVKDSSTASCEFPGLLAAVANCCDRKAAICREEENDSWAEGYEEDAATIRAIIEERY